MLHHVVQGQGRPVLILHGARLDHRHMVESCEPVFAGLDGWRRIYVDMPGHGQSGGGDAVKSNENLLDAVLDFAQAAIPGKRFAVIGESRGSYIARGIAYKRPEAVDGLALIVPGGNPSSSHPLPGHVTVAANPALRAALPEDERPRFDALVVQNEEIMDKARRTIVPALALSDAGMAARTWEHFDFPFDLAAPEAVFDKPCVIVAGRQDAISGYRDALDMLPLYPRSTFAILDSAGHKLAWERPDVFTALMRDWLGRLARG